MLNQRGGFPVLIEDGAFGPATEASVNHYQQNENLSVDGVVGKQTWTSLCPSGSCSPNPAETAAHSRTSPTHRGGTPMAEPVLKKGSNDPAVRDLQDALKALGYDPGPIDSVFGENTDSAVRKFQQAREIPVDGIVGRVTWINIDEADQSEPVLKFGSAGLPVRRLQSRMSAVGFDTGGVDGRFGTKTEAAVKKLQQDFHLSVDAVVGPQTWNVVNALENEGGVS
jgi:peptidoglycan hydrolase-like protein with peptidoglycan-binding domain